MREKFARTALRPADLAAAQARVRNLLGRLSAMVLAGLAASVPAAATPLSTVPPDPGLERLASPVAVFGPDDRASLPPQRSALGASIGLLYESRSHSVCTAFCVG